MIVGAPKPAYRVLTGDKREADKVEAIDETGKILSLRLLQLAKQIDAPAGRQGAPPINHPGRRPAEKAKAHVVEIEPYRIEKELLALSSKLLAIVFGKQPGK